MGGAEWSSSRSGGEYGTRLAPRSGITSDVGRAARAVAAACPTATCPQTCPALPPAPRAGFRVLRGVAQTDTLTKFKWDLDAFNNTIAAATWLAPGANAPGPRAWHGTLYGAGVPDGQPTGATLMLLLVVLVITGGRADG